MANGDDTNKLDINSILTPLLAAGAGIAGGIAGFNQPNTAPQLLTQGARTGLAAANTAANIRNQQVTQELARRRLAVQQANLTIAQRRAAQQAQLFNQFAPLFGLQPTPTGAPGQPTTGQAATSSAPTAPGTIGLQPGGPLTFSRPQGQAQAPTTPPSTQPGQLPFGATVQIGPSGITFGLDPTKALTGQQSALEVQFSQRFQENLDLIKALIPDVLPKQQRQIAFEQTRRQLPNAPVPEAFRDLVTEDITTSDLKASEGIIRGRPLTEEETAAAIQRQSQAEIGREVERKKALTKAEIEAELERLNPTIDTLSRLTRAISIAATQPNVPITQRVTDTLASIKLFDRFVRINRSAFARIIQLQRGNLTETEQIVAQEMLPGGLAIAATTSDMLSGIPLADPVKIATAAHLVVLENTFTKLFNRPISFGVAIPDRIRGRVNRLLQTHPDEMQKGILLQSLDMDAIEKTAPQPRDEDGRPIPSAQDKEADKKLEDMHFFEPEDETPPPLSATPTPQAPPQVEQTPAPTTPPAVPAPTPSPAQEESAVTPATRAMGLAMSRMNDRERLQLSGIIKEFETEVLQVPGKLAQTRAERKIRRLFNSSNLGLSPQETDLAISQIILDVLETQRSGLEEGVIQVP